MRSVEREELVMTGRRRGLRPVRRVVALSAPPPARPLWLTLAGLLVLMALAASCGGASPRGPRAVTLDVDACDYCHMPVSDATLAAQWVPVSGPIAIFDEPGCLLAWLKGHPEGEGQAYVALAPGGEWVPTDSAVYLAGAVRTGMGFDVVALATREEALERAAAAPGEAEILTWTELEQRGVAHAHHH